MLNHFKSLGLAGLAIAAVSASALPETDSALAKRTSFDFAFRFYEQSDCNHSDNPSTEYPQGGAALGGNRGQCYSAPLGVNWQRLETNNDGGPNGVTTYCNFNCQGGATAPQRGGCFTPPPGCALGSFREG